LKNQTKQARKPTMTNLGTILLVLSPMLALTEIFLLPVTVKPVTQNANQKDAKLSQWKSIATNDLGLQRAFQATKKQILDLIFVDNTMVMLPTLLENKQVNRSSSTVDFNIYEVQKRTGSSSIEYRANFTYQFNIVPSNYSILIEQTQGGDKIGSDQFQLLNFEFIGFNGVNGK